MSADELAGLSADELVERSELELARGAYGIANTVANVAIARQLQGVRALLGELLDKLDKADETAVDGMAAIVRAVNRQTPSSRVGR